MFIFSILIYMISIFLYIFKVVPLNISVQAVKPLFLVFLDERSEEQHLFQIEILTF